MIERDGVAQSVSVNERVCVNFPGLFVCVRHPLLFALSAKFVNRWSVCFVCSCVQLLFVLLSFEK